MDSSNGGGRNTIGLHKYTTWFEVNQKTSGENIISTVSYLKKVMETA